MFSSVNVREAPSIICNLGGEVHYKGFISDWRERYIEVPKDIRKGKIWKPYDINIPEYWSENANYSIKTTKYKFFLVVDYGDEKSRYQLNNELISLLSRHNYLLIKDDD